MDAAVGVMLRIADKNVEPGSIRRGPFVVADSAREDKRQRSEDRGQPALRRLGEAGRSEVGPDQERSGMLDHTLAELIGISPFLTADL